MKDPSLMRIDLHTHPIPKPGFLEKLVNQCIKAEMDIVAITDVGDERYTKLKRYAVKLSPFKYMWHLTERGFIIIRDYDKKGVKFIRGQEVFTTEGHVLTVGAKTKIPDYQTLESTLKQAKDFDAIIIADHPFVPKNVWGGIGRENLEKYLEYFDAIEWNAQCINLFPYPKFLMQAQANEKAEQFSKEHNIPLVADSDAHFTGFGSLSQIGLSYIELHGYKYTEDEHLIAKLRLKIQNNEYKNVKNEISRFGFLRWCVPLYLKKLFTKKNGHDPRID